MFKDFTSAHYGREKFVQDWVWLKKYYLFVLIGHGWPPKTIVKPISLIFQEINVMHFTLGLTLIFSYEICGFIIS